MKRILSLILIASLLLLIAACGGDNDNRGDIDKDDNDIGRSPVDSVNTDGSSNDDSAAASADSPGKEKQKEVYNLYRSLSDTFSGTGSKDGDQFDADFSVIMDMNVMGENMVMGMDGNMKMIIDGDDVRYYMLMDMDMFGINTSMEMFYNNGKVYCEIDGMEIPMEPDAFMDQFDSAMILPEFNEEDFADIEIRNHGDDIEYYITISGDELNDLVAGELASSLGDTDVNISDIEISYIVDSDNNPKSLYMNFSMDMDIEGETATVKTEINYVFNKFGSGVTINFPNNM